MITFLFWNLNKKSLEGRVARLAEKHEVDIVILAECSIPPQSMIDALHQRTGRRFNLPFSACEKIVIYTLLPFFRNEELKILAEDGEESLVNQVGLPDDSIASDPLPILFRLNL